MKQNSIDSIQIKQGPPSNMEGRLEKEIRVHRLLEKLGINYHYLDHEEAMTMEACVEIDQALGTNMCKNLFLCNRKKTQFYLLMMPGPKVFDTKEVSKLIGSNRLSFAREEYLEEFLDLTPGSVTVLGLMNDTDNRVQLLVDEEILQGEYIGCHPCINTSSLRLKTTDLFEKILPAIGHEGIVLQLRGKEA